MLTPTPPLRLRAWLLTGPIGHLVAGALDWGALIVHVARCRMRGEDPF
ncbi:MAG: hypothetical protein NTV40_06585 [Solirubrobacterales bacterium]|nr:hypothetical protein [Solirubrobacterales bacterium]